jgi:hypothetical protein
MAITGRNSGEITNSPATMVASATPTSRIVKGIIITNRDTIEHNFTVTCGHILIELLLKAGDNLHYNNPIAIGANNLTAVLGEAVVTTNPSFVCSWLDEAETV